MGIETRHGAPRGARGRPARRAVPVGGFVAVLAVVAAVAAGLVSGSGSRSSAPPPPASWERAVAATTTSTAPRHVTTPELAPVVDAGRRDRPIVALTFDSNLTDAMIQELNAGEVTSFANVAVIDELDRLQVPATLFLAGKWIERYPDVTRRLAADPLFELGSHSYAHRAFHLPCYHLEGLPPGAMAGDVDRSETLLRQYTARATPYFRFPGGCYDRAALRAIASTGVTVVQFDLPSGDAFGTSVTAIVSNVVRNARPGSIVVMHITGGNTAPLTAWALPGVVNGLRSRGLQLVRVSDLLAAPTTP